MATRHFGKKKGLVQWVERLDGFALAAVMLLTLLPGCAGSKTAGKDRNAIAVYMWSGGLYDSYAPYVQSQLPDIITCRRFALHDAAGLKDTGSVHLRGGGQGL